MSVRVARLRKRVARLRKRVACLRKVLKEILERG